MPRKAAKPNDNSAAVALQFGISLKALRHYERLGLLAAPRTAAGWRVYGQAEIERLHAILSLKQLGLPLARIAELFKAGSTDLSALLSVQEEMLRQSRRETDRALELIAIARERIREKQRLTGEELSALVRNIDRSVLRMTPELDALAQRIYTPEQLARLHDEKSPRDASRSSEAWTQIMADLEAMLPDGDPLSERSLAIVRRMVALIQSVTRGDGALWNNSYRFWKEAVADPQTAEQLPMTRKHWDFVAEAMAELSRRGEIAP